MALAAAAAGALRAFAGHSAGLGRASVLGSLRNFAAQPELEAEQGESVSQEDPSAVPLRSPESRGSGSIDGHALASCNGRIAARAW